MEGLGQRLGHEGKLGLRPNLRVRLERLLDLRVECASLDGDDLRGGIRVVGDGRAAGWAKDAVHSLSRGTLSGPGLGLAADRELVLWNDGDEGCVSGGERSCMLVDGAPRNETMEVWKWKGGVAAAACRGSTLEPAPLLG